MRSRRFGEAFFSDDRLAELDPLARIFFLGLLACADREGRLEDRPRKLKALCLPFDNADPEAMLADLARLGLIRRYTVDGVRLVAVLGFRADGSVAYQRPHPNEAASTLPPPPAEDNLGTPPRSTKGDPRGDSVTVTVTETVVREDHLGGSPSGSPRAPASRAKRARKGKAADQPALLAPEPAPACQVDPDRLPKDNPDSHPGRLARLLAELILARDPKARVPDPARKRDEPGLYKWACEIDRLNRRDRRTWVEIESIIRFCQDDPFWRGNILSAGKLRKQFTTLVAQADRGKPAPRPATAAEPSVRELRAVTVGPEGGQA